MDEMKWKWLSLEDAYKERPPTEWIVEDMFSTGSMNIVYGPPASKKSMLMQDMCAHIAAGKQWLVAPNGMGGFAVKQVPVLWIDLDNGRLRTLERFDAVGRAQELDMGAGIHFVSMPSPHLDANDLDAMTEIMKAIYHFGAKLVVVDNLGTTTGDVEENTAGMAIVMKNWRIVAERTEAAIVLIHHQRKGNTQGGRAGDALRGHSSIEASIDLAIAIKPLKDKSVLIRSTKTRGMDITGTLAEFHYEHVADTNDLAMAWFEGVSKKKVDDPIKSAIIYAIRHEGEMSKNKLAHEVQAILKRGRESKAGLGKIKSWIEHMELVEKILTVRDGDRNAKLYSLSDKAI